jgi:hypothetical protein
MAYAVAMAWLTVNRLSASHGLKVFAMAQRLSASHVMMEDLLLPPMDWQALFLPPMDCRALMVPPIDRRALLLPPMDCRALMVPLMD